MSEQAFWEKGSEITRHNLNRSAKVGMRRFRSHFGTTPQICSMIWAELDVKHLHHDQAQPLHMLCALLFLKRYESDSVNRSCHHSIG